MTSEPAELPGKQALGNNGSNRGDEGAPPSASAYGRSEFKDSDTASLARAIGDAGEAVDMEKPSEAASKLADVAKDAAKAAFQAVSAQASELASNVADELAKSGENQKHRGAETMRTFAGAMEHAADDMNEQSPLAARQFRAAARKVGDLSESLRDRTIAELFSAATDLARRQPLWFFAGAVAAGFALSRFLKSSAAPPSPSSVRSEPASPSAPDLPFSE